MPHKLLKCALCIVGIALMVFAVSSGFRLRTLAASNKAINLQDFPDVRLVTLGIIDDTKAGSINAAKAVQQIEMRLMLIMGAGLVMVLVGFFFSDRTPESNDRSYRLMVCWRVESGSMFDRSMNRNRAIAQPMKG